MLLGTPLKFGVLFVLTLTTHYALLVMFDLNCMICLEGAWQWKGGRMSMKLCNNTMFLALHPPPLTHMVFQEQ